MTNYTLHLTQKQAAEISRACEILARLRMGQIDMALRELPLDKPMEYEQERYISNYLRSLYHQDGRQLHQVSWDLHQVIRHRLAWDRAYAEGTVRPGEPRKWPEMMGVIYDEPLPMGEEPLAKIESSDALELARHRIHSLECLVADLRAEIGGDPAEAYLPETGVRNG